MAVSLVGPEWPYKPNADAWQIDYDGPRVLSTEFSDGWRSVREKWSGSKRLFRGNYTVLAAEAGTMQSFFRLRRYGTEFSIYSFDPEAKDPDTDLALVKFVAPRGRPRWISAKLLIISWSFREL